MSGGDIGAGGAKALERRLAHKRRGFRTKRLYADLAALQARLRAEAVR